MFPEDEYEKIWLATDDSRTRHTHNLTDGQRVPYSAHFAVGADEANALPGVPMLFPGDPSGPPEEVINCRCTMLLVEKGESVDYSNRGFKGLTAATVTPGKAVTAPVLLASALNIEPDFASLLASAWITNDWKLHATCSTTFCRNPLHPGPCKGWKHTLKKVAPGAYDALEKVRIQKLEEKRKSKIKALQEAGKKIPKHLTKPIKSIEPKPGPVDTNPDQPPLKPATEKKLADVAAKTKKAFEAPKKSEAVSKVEGLFPSGGELQHTTLTKDPEVKLAALQDLFPQEYDNLPDGLKKNVDYFLDGSTVKGVGALKARLRGKPSAAPKEGEAPPKADAEKLTLKAAGLKPGDKVWLHTHSGEGQTDFGPKAKPGDQPILATVVAEKNAYYGGAKGTVSLSLHDSNGEFLNGGSATAKYWISPEGGGKFSDKDSKNAPNLSTPEAPKSGPKDGDGDGKLNESDKPSASTAPKAKEKTPTDPANAAANMAFAPQNFTKSERIEAYGELSQADVDSLNEQDTSNLVDDLIGLQSSTLSPAEQKKVDAAWAKLGQAGTTDALAAPEPTPHPTVPNVKKADLDTPQGIDAHAKPTSSVNPATVGKVGGTSKAAQEHALEVTSNSHKYSYAQIVGAYEGLSKNDFDGMSASSKAAIADKLKAIAANPTLPAAQRQHAAQVAAKLGSTGLHGTDNQVNLGKAVQSGDFDEIAAAAVKMSKDELTGSPTAHVAALKKAIKDLQGTGLKSDKDLADELNAKFFDKKPSVKPPAAPAAPDLNTPDHGTAPSVINPAIAPKKNPDNSFNDWQAAKTTVTVNTYPNGTTASTVSKMIVNGDVEERLDVYSGLSKEKFESLPVEIQAAVVADLDNVHVGSKKSFFTPTQATRAEALRTHLTGAEPLTDFQPKTPTATPAKAKKFVSPAAEAGYNTAQTIGNGNPHARLQSYRAMSKDEFESLPATTQKQIVNDLANMLYSKSADSSSEYHADFGSQGYNNANKNAAKATLVALTGQDTAKGFKPKTVAQKKHEQALSSVTAPAKTKPSKDFGEYLKKIQTAKQDSEALQSPPMSLSLATHPEQNKPGAGHFDAWTKFDTPDISGPEMYLAANDYKGAGYVDINNGLRTRKGDTSGWTGYEAKRVKALDAAMKQSGLKNDVQTKRGFTKPSTVFGTTIWNNGNTDLTGLEWTEHGYSSTTTNDGIADTFADIPSSLRHVGEMKPGQYGYDISKDRVVMNIFTPKGFGAIEISGDEFEYEVLLDRGARYRVVRDRGVVDGARRLDVEIINGGVNGGG
jgi:hypothetical protein